NDRLKPPEDNRHSVPAESGGGTRRAEAPSGQEVLGAEVPSRQKALGCPAYRQRAGIRTPGGGALPVPAGVSRGVGPRRQGSVAGLRQGARDRRPAAELLRARTRDFAAA